MAVRGFPSMEYTRAFASSILSAIMSRPDLYSPVLLWILWAIHILLLVGQMLATAVWILDLQGRGEEEHVPP